jgi:hypothetical protein
MLTECFQSSRLVASFVALCYSQTPPTIASSFSATTVAIFANRTHAGTEFVDAQNQRSAFVHKFTNGDIDDEVAFTGNHTAYHFGIYNGTAHCEVARDPRPWFNVWEWVAQSKAAGSCTANGQSGQAWSVANNEGTITLCANGAIPLQVEFKAENGHIDATTYTSFTAGVPPPSDFTVPAHCHPHA